MPACKGYGRSMLLVSVFITCLFTSTNVYAATTGNVFLWSVPSKNNTVYLLGSVHVLKKDAYPLDKRINKAYEVASCIMFEADMAEAALPATRMKMLAAGMYQDGTTLKQHISQGTYEILKEKVAVSGMSIDQFDLFKPWLCAVTLSGLELKRMGFDPIFGIDSHFFVKAQHDKKELIFLESPDYQIDLIAGVLADKPEDLLKQTMTELGVIEAMSTDMLGAWIGGDAQKMESIVSMSLKEYPQIRTRLFDQRNTDWTAKIEKLIGVEKNVLVIVGAGHLIGEHGVLDQLKYKGYPVVQQ